MIGSTVLSFLSFFNYYFLKLQFSYWEHILNIDSGKDMWPENKDSQLSTGYECKRQHSKDQNQLERKDEEEEMRKGDQTSDEIKESKSEGTQIKQACFQPRLRTQSGAGKNEKSKSWKNMTKRYSSVTGRLCTVVSRSLSVEQCRTQYSSLSHLFVSFRTMIWRVLWSPKAS